MNNYRIIEHDGLFYPEKKVLGLFWYAFYRKPNSCIEEYGFIYRTGHYYANYTESLEEAKRVIDFDYKLEQTKRNRVKPVSVVHKYDPADKDMS
jgi:hypothetical protein